ncbi:hypothetical protein ANN_23599 [Periplaneta americana]|uniref:DUF4817 domain-containing protein n=1 Tax=Periplaneta americana TaxID=6978 RepID=A0ABQ8SLJ2_PERAM|nr:hypothetical protein ANN_23599 [Periplaneta americana]
MYSNQKLAEIHFMYGKADGNAALARRLYQEWYPQRQCPDRNTFVRLHYRMCEYGKFNSPDRWIGRGGPIAWPPRSPDVNPLDFYLWGHLKSLVYSSPVPDLESLRNRIVACSEDIRNTPGVWDRVRRSMRHRYVHIRTDHVRYTLHYLRCFSVVTCPHPSDSALNGILRIISVMLPKSKQVSFSLADGVKREENKRRLQGNSALPYDERWVKRKKFSPAAEFETGFQLYVLTLYPLSHTGFQFRCRIESSQFKFHLLVSL